MSILKCTDGEDDQWQYDTERDIVTVSCDGGISSFPLLLSDQKYFIVKNNEILIVNDYDTLVNDHADFFLRCLSRKCSLIGINFTHIQENEGHILKFHDADFAFFCLTFSEYIE